MTFSEEQARAYIDSTLKGKPDRQSFLYLSADHLDVASSKYIADNRHDYFGRLNINGDEYGSWIFTVNIPTEVPGVPEVLLRIIEFTNSHGCSAVYLSNECLPDKVDELPRFAL